MSRYCGNIYKQAREQAGLTQLQASELLPVPVRTLSEYENGRLLPSNELVIRMIKVYDSDTLGYQHLQRNTLIGRICLPDIEFTGLAQSVLRLQKEMADVERIKPEMVEVAYDNIVQPHQEDTWNMTTKEVMEMVGAGLGVLFYQKEKRASAEGSY